MCYMCFVTVAAAASLQFQGCFNDLGSYRDLQYEMALAGDITPLNCMAACKNSGYLYAGLQVTLIKRSTITSHHLFHDLTRHVFIY